MTEREPSACKSNTTLCCYKSSLVWWTPNVAGEKCKLLLFTQLDVKPGLPAGKSNTTVSLEKLACTTRQNKCIITLYPVTYACNSWKICSFAESMTLIEVGQLCSVMKVYLAFRSVPKDWKIFFFFVRTFPDNYLVKG